MTRKRAQISFARAQAWTAGQRTGNSQLAGESVVADVDFSSQSVLALRLRRNRRCERGRSESGIISLKTDFHSICIFYRHVL